MHVLSSSSSFLYVPVTRSQLAPFPNCSCSSPFFFLQSDRVKKRRKARRWWKEMLPAVSGGNGAMRSNFLDESTFLASLMPKKEINADKFIEAHPEFDGRGVIIAIFDSGVDPAAAGLQLTSDGKPKILDVIDCTGSGDIDTSKIVKADADGCIIGASGAKLILNSSWKNPSGDWHVGYKLAYELFTEELRKRLKVERRKKWDEKNQKAISEALKHLHEFDQKHKKVDDVELKRIREDFENRVDLLRKHSETYDDKGPVIDAVVWCDGDTWRVALDTQSFEEEEDAGKLASFQPMTNYRIERGYGVFSKLDACSFVTNVYEEGNVLSLVTDSSPHGTHVAGITSAYHPKEPLLNGIAPGAQLISCKIGDSRLGSMETGTGLTRAVIAAVEHKCDLINMSYGEPTMLPDYGRFIDLVNEAVDKYRLIYVSSAGNSGPALSTVGAPGGTSSSIIGVGAYVSPSMSAAAHAVIEPLQEGIEYTWSSRGPTADGNLGVSISAPGCAVAPVPTWTLQKRMLMNGTSMASPCACGGVALLISAMKAENIPVSPYSVRTSIENTALPLGSRAEEKLTTGHGLLQVDRAYDYIQQAKSLPSVSYTVKVNRAGKSNASRRGIYLREGASSQYSTEWSVQIEPKFHEDASKLDQLVPFEECIQLHSSDPSVVKAPEYLLLTNNGRSFNVIVDPSRLAEGLHYYEVYGTDCKSPWRGSLFQVPITIVKPLSIQQKPLVVSFTGLSFSPGCIERRFIEVPENATWGEATMRTSGFDTTRRFFIDIVQLCPKRRPIKWERVVTHPSPTLQNFSFPIEGGFTMELAIAQFWSSGIGSNEATIVDFQIEFHGVSVTMEVLFDGGDSAARIPARASLSSERLIPTAVLKQVRTPLRPSECDLKPLSVKRDSLPSGKQIMALTLTYKFKLEESSEITPKVPLLNDRVYDSLFESQFYMISDSNKRIYGMGDIYPKAVKLPKGEYSLQLHVRHENIQHLERMKEMVLFIDRSLAEKEFVRLSFSSLPDGHLTGDGSFKSLTLLPGETEAFYMAPPSKDNLPKTCLAGSILHGDVTYGVLSFGAKKDDNSPGSCPVHYPISYVIPPNKDGKDKGKAASENLKSVSELLNEEIRDAKLKVLSSIKRGTEEEVTKWRELANSLKAEYPKYTPLLHMILEGLLTRGSDCYTVAENKEIISAADEVIESIDKDELAKYFLERVEPEDDKAEELKKKMETTRDQLAEALYRKGLAIAENDSLQVQEQQVTPDQEQASEKANRFEENFKELKRWVDVKSPKYALISVLNERRCQRLGTALKLLCSLIQEDANPPKKKHYELKLSLLDELGWIHVAEYERRWMHVRFPPSLPLF